MRLQRLQILDICFGLLYPDINELKYAKKIDVSCHSVKYNESNKEWNEIYSYYQNGYPYTSDEIVPDKLNIGRQNTIKYLNNFTFENKKNKKKFARYFVSDDTIKHNQSFNLVKDIDNVYIIMKFTGKYKITILKSNLEQ